MDRAPIDEDSDDSEGEGKDDNQKKSETVKAPSALNIHEPVAGPWAAVGKHLQFVIFLYFVFFWLSRHDNFSLGR